MDLYLLQIHTVVRWDFHATTTTHYLSKYRKESFSSHESTDTTILTEYSIYFAQGYPWFRLTE